MSTTGVPARLAALLLVGQVLRKHRPFDEAIAAALRPGGRLDTLDDRDRGFARALAATVLRRLGQIDDAVARCLDRPLDEDGEAVRDVLRLGAAQLLFLATPAHAAVDSTVQLVLPRSPLRGLINAVLPRPDREGAAIVAGQDAVALACPAWLSESWDRAYGEAVARDIVAAHLAEPPLDLTLRGPADGWAERLEAAVLPTGSLRRRGGGAVGRLPGFARGAWWVQDVGGALPARLLGDVAGRRVLDLCCAPGGKTMQLVAAGAEVTAVDMSRPRLRQVRENLRRTRGRATLVEADATQWQPEAAFDAVLLDAPCSATGTIRRHPDVWHLKAASDVARLADLQARLLDNAVRLLAPGGVLVYCVCSLQHEEGPAHSARLLDAGLRRVPVRPTEVGGMAELVTEAGELRTLPCHLAAEGGMDGFHAARFVAA